MFIFPFFLIYIIIPYFAMQFKKFFLIVHDNVVMSKFTLNIQYISFYLFIINLPCEFKL